MNDILTEKYNNDFNTALNIYENSYSHEHLIEFLKQGSVAEKQAAALKLDKINSIDEAKIFIQNLTGCDGKIREGPGGPDRYLRYDGGPERDPRCGAGAGSALCPLRPDREDGAEGAEHHHRRGLKDP